MRVITNFILFCVIFHESYEKDFLNISKKSEIYSILDKGDKVWITYFHSSNSSESTSSLKFFKNISTRLSERKKLSFLVIDCDRFLRICLDYQICDFPRLAFLYKSYIIEYRYNIKDVRRILESLRRAKIELSTVLAIAKNESSSINLTVQISNLNTTQHSTQFSSSNQRTTQSLVKNRRKR